MNETQEFYAYKFIGRAKGFYWKDTTYKDIQIIETGLTKKKKKNHQIARSR